MSSANTCACLINRFKGTSVSRRVICEQKYQTVFYFFLVINIFINYWLLVGC